MKSFTLATIILAVGAVSAQNSTAPATSTITIKPACPTGPAADVIVTRSDAPVPSCAAGSNATKPSIVSMSMPSSMMGSPTGTGGAAMFTGAAGQNAVGGMMALAGGAFVAFML